MSNIYQDGTYLSRTETWHLEDSPWKASHILRMLTKNNIEPGSLAEVGCGAGGVLNALSKSDLLQNCQLVGYDISPQAIQLSKKHSNDRVEFQCGDAFDGGLEYGDVLLAIDVFEHVPDYLGFLTACQSLAEFKLYHIPLDLHVSSILRASFIDGRTSLGHLHYFTAESAIESLRDTGHEIVDSFYTCAAADLVRYHRSPKRIAASLPRRIAAKISPELGARYLGGFSLMVLAR